MEKSKEGVTGETCGVSVQSDPRWPSFHICARPAKGVGKDGKPLCGIHLADERRRDTTAEKWKTKWNASNEFQKEVEDFAHEHIALGISANRHESRTVIVSFDELKALLSRLS